MNAIYKAFKTIVSSPIYCSCLLILPLAPHASSSEENTPSEVQFVPLLQYENLNLTSQSIRSFSTGMVINSENALFVGMYSSNSFEESVGSGASDHYSALDLLIDVKKGRHQYLGILKGESDQWLSSELEDYQAAAVYGYEWIDNADFSFVFGGGFALGDFGIETSSGKNWPLIPVPLLRLKYQSNLLDAQFEFLTSPNVSFTLAPKAKVRVNGDFRLDQMRDSRDIIFETTLDYRPFSEDSAMGDFAGISVGFKNDTYNAYVQKNDLDESTEVQYQALFTAIDLSLLKVSTGYAFNGRSRFNNAENQDAGEGLYFSVQGMYAF